MPGLPSIPADGSGDQRSRRRPLRLGSVVGVVVLATSATPLAGISAQADATGPAATVTLRTVEPAVPHSGDTLVLTGVIENTGDQTLRDVQAILRYSAVPLDDRDDVHNVATDQELRWGQRYVDFYQEVDPRLEPGEIAEYVLRIPVDQINFADPGVYTIGVDIRAEPADGERLTLGTARTVVPWIPEDKPLPTVPVGLLWPLATQPTLLPDGTLLGDSLAKQLAPDGTLTAMVGAPGAAPVTWVVDPDLLASVGTMVDGYAVATPEGTTIEGTGAASAEAWLKAFGAATKEHQLVLLPYANPDLPAVAQADGRAAADTAREALATTTDWASQTELTQAEQIAWPGSGAADDRTLAALASAGTRTVVLASDAVIGPTDAARAQVRSGETDLDAVLTDSGLSYAIAASAAADPMAGAVALRQAWLAETVLTAMAAADEAASPTPLIAAPPYGWRPSPEVARALIDVWTTTPWVRAAALSDIPTPRRPAVVVPDPAATAIPPELTPEYVADVSVLGRASSRYAALLAEPDALVGELRTATLRALATTWRAAPEAGTAYITEAMGQVSPRLGKVSVLVPESVTLSSKKGTFPLTVSNGLPQPVLVRVAVAADYPDRLSVADVLPQRVEAGENATVEVTAEANANGKVPVTVRLTAADGSPLGPPERMVVNATDYGTIGWLVIGLAVALFFAAAVLRLVRARRRVGKVVEVPVTTPTESEALRETAR
jgi:Family of unknown function (DUF6049)